MSIRSDQIGGPVLILLGRLLVVCIWQPVWFIFSWPLYVLGIGIFFLFSALFSHIRTFTVLDVLSQEWEEAYIPKPKRQLGMLHLCLKPNSWFSRVEILLASFLSPSGRVDHSGWYLACTRVISFVIFSGIFSFGSDLVKF